jgi:hypothetical protein
MLKLIVFYGYILTKSGPVDRLRFLPDGVILNFFHVKFIKMFSNGPIDIHLIVPPSVFFNYEPKKIQIVLSAKLESSAGKTYYRVSTLVTVKFGQNPDLSIYFVFTWWCNFEFFYVKFIKKFSNGPIDIHFLILRQKKSKSYCQVNFKVERRSTQWLHCTVTV